MSANEGDLFVATEELQELVDSPIPQDQQPWLEGDDVTFRPLAVERFAGTLPWEMERDQTLCGDSIVDHSGDLNVRVTMEGYAFFSDLVDLFQLRADSTEVRLHWSGDNEIGLTTVTFDQLQFERVASEDTASGPNGQTRRLYLFQLQSKENTDNDNT